MERFSPDQAARHLEGLDLRGARADRQKAVTDALLEGVRVFAGLLISARDSGLATGDHEEIDVALDALDAAVGAAFRAVVSPVRAEPEAA